MLNLFPPKFITSIAILLVATLVGCSHERTPRGHLFRGDWAVEYNRTPWIGCPPDSGYPPNVYEEVSAGRTHGLFACLKDGSEKNRKRFRHHCAQNAECSPKDPCCRTLGCGMWVDSEDPTTLATLGGAARACGLLPFCTPQKPCCLTPNCGRPTNVNVNPQTLIMSNQHGMLGRNGLSGVVSGNAAAMQGAAQGGTVTIRGMNPTETFPSGILPNGMSPTGTMPNGTMPNGTMPNGAMHGGTVGAVVPGVTLVSRGVVPGASAITSGGMVAAIGVATPAGTMTPVGVRLPNGTVNNAIVIRACVMTPTCTAARPCCVTPNCGGAVAVNMVANNATVLASALHAQGVAGGVMQAGGMGMLVNPITNQPIPGLTMSGYTQVGYPPIGYAPTGYAPGYPRFAAGMVDTGTAEEMHEKMEEKDTVLPSETRSSMPVPRFHSIPKQPTFQRSEGMPQLQQTSSPITTAMTGQREMSGMEVEAALEQAYLEGVSAAMDEVERKLEEKRQAVARAKLQEKILLQAEYVQQQLDAQEEMRMLAIQRERQLQQQALRQQALQQRAMAAAPASHRAPVKSGVSTNGNNANTIPAQLAENLKTSVVGGVNEIFAPLLGANQTHQRVQAQTVTPPRQQTARPKTQVAAVQPEVPGKPPVSSVALNYGLLPDDEPESYIMQAQFTDDGVAIQP